MRSSTTPDFPESGVQEPFSKKVCREFIVGDLIDETDWYDVTTQESSVTCCKHTSTVDATLQL